MPAGYEQAKAVLAVAAELERLEAQKALGSPWEAAGERERAALQIQRQTADAASAAFQARLKAAYADPRTAAEVWERLKGAHGTGKAGRLVEAQPEALGRLRGGTWLWGLVPDRERQAAHQAAHQVVPAAIARGRAWAAYAGAKPGMETAERAALSRPEVAAGREAAAVLDRLKMSSAAVHRQAEGFHRAAELSEVRRLAREADLGPGKAPGKVRYDWKGQTEPELERRNALFDKHPEAAKAALVEAFKERNPEAFKLWDGARIAAERLTQSLSRGRGLGRGR